MIYYGYEGGSKLTSYVTTRGVQNCHCMLQRGGFKTAIVCYNQPLPSPNFSVNLATILKLSWLDIGIVNYIIYSVNLYITR